MPFEQLASEPHKSQTFKEYCAISATAAAAAAASYCATTPGIVSRKMRPKMRLLNKINYVISCPGLLK